MFSIPVHIPDYQHEIKLFHQCPIANSDGCGFIVSVQERYYAGMTNCVFLSVGKLELLMGRGGSTIFWSIDVFNETVNLLRDQIDAYSIGETLNTKALRPVLQTIIDRHAETGEIEYKQHREMMHELMSELRAHAS